MKHSIEYFLDVNDTLTPSDLSLGDIASSEWWIFLKPLFDDLLWMYYGDRVVFYNRRFPEDNDQKCINNIIRTFIINLKTKARNYDRLFNVYMMDYNPLWNVDGVTGIVTQDDHTGTNTRTKTGDDTVKASGTDTDTLSGSDVVSSDGSDVVTLSGRDTDTLSGRDVDTLSGSDVDTLSGSDTVSESITKDDTTRNGNEVIADSGTDTVTRQVTTFDSNDAWLNHDKDSTLHGKSETHTYNNVKDAHEKESEVETSYGKVDTMAYGKVDTMSYGKVDTMAYGKVDTTEYGREDTTEYGKVDTKVYGRQDKTTYNTEEEEERDLSDKHLEMQIRQGNIGVTSSQSLYQQELDAWRNELNIFAKNVVKDCVNLVSYAVEGV